MFDIENIDICKCRECGCPNYKKDRRSRTTLPNPSVCAGEYFTVHYCKLDVDERYYDCPLFRADVDRITDIVRFEVKQVTCYQNGKVGNLGWHIFDNDYGHLIDTIDTFEFEDKDKIDKLCEWLNKLDDSASYRSKMSEKDDVNQ